MSRKILLGIAVLGLAFSLRAAPALAAAPKAAKPPVVKVNKDQLIKDVLPLFIKVYGNNPTESEKTWWRKRISCGELTSDAAIVSSMQFHKQKKVRIGSDDICGGTAKKSSGSSGSVSAHSIDGIDTHPNGAVVRIGIYHTTGSAIHVTADGEFTIRSGDSVIGKVGKDDDVAVSWSEGKYHVRGSGLNNDPKEPVRFAPVSSHTIMKIASYSDPSKTYPGKNYNRFRGVIEIRKCDNCNELWAINELRTEQYLYGLGETSGDGPEEYLKALVVAARTYVLYHHAVTGERAPNKGFDITNTDTDQIYRGYEHEIIAPRLADMVNATRGIIVTNSSGDTPVVTIYFSDSDGRTRSAEEIFHTKRFPWLQSVPDPYHSSSICLGHCVGMSAQGAYGFAKKENWDFKKILNYYYKDIRLVKAY